MLNQRLYSNGMLRSIGPNIQARGEDPYDLTEVIVKVVEIVNSKTMVKALRGGCRKISNGFERGRVEGN